MEETLPMLSTRRTKQNPVNLDHLTKSPRAPMEFLSRSWSASALEVSKALSHPPLPLPPSCMASSKSSSNSSSSNSSSSCNTATTTSTIPEDIAGESEELPVLSGHQFYFASSVTSQLVLDRIMSQSMREVCFSGPLLFMLEILSDLSCLFLGILYRKVRESEEFWMRRVEGGAWGVNKSKCQRGLGGYNLQGVPFRDFRINLAHVREFAIEFGSDTWGSGSSGCVSRVPLWRRKSLVAWG